MAALSFLVAEALEAKRNGARAVVLGG